MKKKITIEINPNEVKVDIDGVSNFTDLLVALATFEGVVGGIMDADKTTIRTAIDEIQKDIKATLTPSKVVVEDDDGVQ